jgi:hypothetical protein
LALFALDQNFPEPIIQALDGFIPEAELVPLRDVDPLLAENDDWEVLLALHHNEREWDASPWRTARFDLRSGSLLRGAGIGLFQESEQVALVLKSTEVMVEPVPRHIDATGGQEMVEVLACLPARMSQSAILPPLSRSALSLSRACKHLSSQPWPAALLSRHVFAPAPDLRGRGAPPLLRRTARTKSSCSSEARTDFVREWSVSGSNR